ncbi:MAG: hypothetical protein HC905_31845, partial [Bacteroidales bacterium]|nr:hypothetical protein [Bacteroidales bacterium]
MKISLKIYLVVFMLNIMNYSLDNIFAQTDSDLDKKVKEFLDKSGNSWRDMNVPESDGRLLYDI